MIVLILDVRTSEIIASQHFMVPFERNSFFVGQENLIKFLRDSVSLTLTSIIIELRCTAWVGLGKLKLRSNMSME